MSIYTLARGAYRWADRALLRHVPEAWDLRLRAALLRVARRLFPAHITARSATEFANSAPSRRAQEAHLPEWARAEVEALAQIEPALGALVRDDIPVERYVIPWDLTYVGHRYALARRQLHGEYACFLFAGGRETGITADALAALPRPLAVIDVDGATALADVVRTAGADYVALPVDALDVNDYCAVLARLVLQLAPRELRCAAHPLVARCLERHGLALASVSQAGEMVSGTISRCAAPRLAGDHEIVPDTISGAGCPGAHDER